MRKINVDDILRLLNDFRLFPNYQLERRADILFAYYLPYILKVHLEKELDVEDNITHENIIPEFPLQKPNKDDGEKDFRSNKVDYAVFCKKTLYLVELKTDMGSFNNEKQSDYLKRAKEKTAFELVEKIPEIGKNSKQGKKYKHLIERLEEVFVDVCDIKIEDSSWNNKEEYFVAKQTAFKASDLKEKLNKKDVKLVYILPQTPTHKQPEDKGHIDHYITFNQISKYLRRYDKSFSDVLSKKWIPKPTPTGKAARWVSDKQPDA